MNRPGPILALAASATLAAGCAVAARPGASLTPIGREVSFKTDVQPLFDNYCVACHQTGAAQQGLVLEEGLALKRIVGQPSSEAAMPLVSAGDPEKSYLLHKLKGAHLAHGGNGTAMPPGDRLDPESFALIESWIEQGATNN